MKNLSFLFLFFSGFIFSQTPQAILEDLNNFKPGELIVKLKDNVDAGVTYSESGKALSSFNIGELLGIEDKIESSSVMFHQKAIEASIANKEKMKAVYAAKAAANPNNGYSPKEPTTMKNIFVLKTLSETENIKILVNELKNNPNVEYAEPNYNFSIDDFEIEELNSETEDESSETSSTTIDVDDPLYSSQTNILQTNLDDVWDTESTGNGTQIIAILDTGVDYDHPDLAANIWSNSEEKDGIDGYDDDGNGYVDDFRGWDYHHQTNTPLDDNMHGTHVAGIAGAVGNNGIGIAGAAWNVKLMPLKVFQASGIGDAAMIAQGIEYAYMNGATVLNMSFGSYAESFTMKAALENAYSTAILVAAAGNNAVPIGPCMGCAPFYPAAYSFIVGVEDAAGYSNYDQDGPVYSLYSSFLLNYEVVAPGTGILSTIPNGGYGTLTGTSMATPLVAGALSIYAQQQPEDSQELMFGNLINTSGDTYVDFLAAMNAAPIPDIKILTAAISDTIAGNTYQDFEPDSGETIHLYPTIKNYWGLSNGVKVSIEIGGNEFQNEYWNSIINITEPETTTGSVSAYATYQMLSDPLEFTIADDAAHNTQVEFILKAWDEEYPNQIHSIVFKLFIKSSIKLQGLIENDTILYADKEYLIDNTVILKHANLIIKPGVTISFGNNEVLGTSGQIQLYSEPVTDPVTGTTYTKESKILALGTKDSIITFKTDSYTTSYASINGYSLGGSSQGQQYLQDENWNYIYDENGQMQENPFYQESLGSIEEIESLDPYNIPVRFTKNIYSWNGSESVVTGTVQRRMASSLCNYCVFEEGFGATNMNLMNSRFQYSGSAGAGQGPSIFAYKNNLTDYTNGGSYNSYPMSYGYNMHYNNIANLHGNSYENNSTTFGMQYYSSWMQNNYFNLSKVLWTFIDGTGYNSGLWDPVGFVAPGYSGFTEFEGIWLGTGSIDKLKELNIDAFDGAQGVWEYTNPRLTPYEEAHAVVWKVEVNGINSFDNYITMYNNPIGLGMQEFKVYFSKEMDTSVNPRITYGVTQPFTQSIVDEFGTWSEDGKIYTVNHNVTLDHESSSDGINRIRVTEAIELGDGWEIPKEDLRFNILMQASGSASTGFFAEPGLGKIGLEWISSSDIITDILGYNMYRYQIDADGVESDPVKINETLIVEDTDESTTGVYYTDFDVVEGQTYYYKYKILRTSFEETDYFDTISSTPLTSTLGDSNGDFTVDVLDLVHDVDYILGNNPTPFIFLAGDVNADNAINVLDIVGTVDIILNPSDATDTSIGSTDIQYYPSNSIGNAVFTWEGNDLFVEADHNIGGLQLAFSSDFEYTVSSELATIEKLDYIQDDNKVVMLFSFNNTVISSGKTKLLTRLDESKELNIDLAVVGTTSGSKLTAIFEDTNLEDIESPLQSDSLEFLSMIPNPTSGLVNLNYYLPEQMDGVVAKVYDMLGRLVHIQAMESREGMSNTSMQLNKLQTGNYIVIISAEKNGGTKHIANKTLIIK